MINVTPLSALSDNYIWALGPGENNIVAIVDPGEAKPVQQFIADQGLRIGAYLITHHHGDHTDGLDTLLAEHPAPVYGPAAEAAKIAQIDHGLAEGDIFTLDFLGANFEVIEVPGHTLGHIAMHTSGVLLCGDALFRAGCGRVFEGSPEQMQKSLAKLRDLPEHTLVCCGHEYTQKNLAFARAVEPSNDLIANVIAEVDDLRDAGRPSLPGTIAEEREINPFLRWDNPAVAEAASRQAGRTLTDPAEVFATLRSWKDAS